MDVNPLSDVLANMFFHSVGCLFILLMVPVAVQTLAFDAVPFFIFCFQSLAQGGISETVLPRETFEILPPLFSSRVFMLLSLTFKSLIHFQFILVHCVRRWSSFICLHVSIQCFQHHFLNRLSLTHCAYVVASFVNYVLTAKVWVYFWTPFSAPLTYVSAFVPAPCCGGYCALAAQCGSR